MLEESGWKGFYLGKQIGNWKRQY